MPDDDAPCFHCGAPATLLCDHVLGVEIGDYQWHKGSLSSPHQGWFPVVTDESRVFTCDRPLCEACATNRGAIFFDGDEANTGVETRDYCREHADATSNKEFITEVQADVLRGKSLLHLNVIRHP
jgi:hypothetical protein